MINSKQIKQIRIIDYLTYVSHPYIIRGDTLYCCASIVRQGADDPRNLTVSLSRNLWCDQVTGQGGSIIDLVMLHRGLSYRDALKWLDQWSGQRGERDMASQSSLPLPSPPTPQAPAGLVVTRVEPLHSQMWLDYLATRCIAADVAARYLREVWWRTASGTRFGLGWQDVGGAWHMRSKMRVQPKASSRGATLSYYPQGSTELCVYEGMMDYLSMQSMQPHSRDVIVLNSTSHVEAAQAYLSRYRRIHLYLDADDGGDRATTQLQQHAVDVGVEAVDHREAWSRLGINDVNQYVIFLSRRQKVI